jgi:hypothetical protein
MHLRQQPVAASLRHNVRLCADQTGSQEKVATNRTSVGKKRSQSGSAYRARFGQMRDFANAAFSPEIIAAMERAMDSAVAALPEPVSSAHVQMIAESILRTAREGETDPDTLARLALLELQIKPRA